MDLARHGFGALRMRMRIATLVVVAVVLLVSGVASALNLTALGVAKHKVKGRSQTIVVDNRGVTVYELGGESLAKLKCVTRKCFSVWIPVRVKSATSRPRKGKGVPGTLSVLTRVRGGFNQAMLNRHPLYYYKADRGTPGNTKGQGINSFGGSWHVVKGT